MADPAVNAPTATEVIQAGHAELPAEDEFAQDQPNTPARLPGLSLAALGVVFGDIGTGPVYTFRECFNSEHGLPPRRGTCARRALDDLVGADYRRRSQICPVDHASRQPGRGGILALLALGSRVGRERARAASWFYSVPPAPHYSTGTA